MFQHIYRLFMSHQRGKKMRSAMIICIPAFVTLAACGRDSADTGRAGLDTPAIMAMPGDTMAGSGTTTGGMMDPNSASAADLATIPGVTTEIASAITAGRPYASNTTLDGVLSSIPEQQRDSVFSRLWIPVNLNTATDAEILLIPGVGSRMLREFKEYRPWTSLDQFRREIGKYVDTDEVARLERYVAIR